MKVTVEREAPAPVVPPIKTVTIVLTAEEARLLAIDNWCGPKIHAPGYFNKGEGNNWSYDGARSYDGAIMNNIKSVEDGGNLRDLLRNIAITISDKTR